MTRTRFALALSFAALLGCFGTEEPEDHLSGPYVLRNAYYGGATYLAYRSGQSSIGRVSPTVIAAGADGKHVIAKRHPEGNTNVTEYYIVDRSIDGFDADRAAVVVGPLTHEEFVAKRAAMGVSPALDFNHRFGKGD